MPAIAMEYQTERVPRAARPTLSMSLKDGSRFLSLAAIENPHLDAEVLLRHVIGIDRAQLYLRMDDTIKAEDEHRFCELLQRRARREPLAYITGRKEFWSLDFSVTPDVLIPRPETELLVEAALEHTAQDRSWVSRALAAARRELHLGRNEGGARRRPPGGPV